ncbi:acetylxylan esterase [Acidobacteria bacterium AB60]|nr:acetylxylan esterase [Acidobacteria bacterium AB60]
MDYRDRARHLFLGFFSLLVCVPGAAQGAPVHLTAAEDRERLLRLLGLSDAEMRKPPAGNPSAPDATNYDEARAHRYPDTPDPLRMQNGKVITHEQEWWSERRPEIVADFEREIFGHAPASLPAVHWQVLSSTHERYGNVDAITRRMVGVVDNSIDPQINVDIDLVLTVPAKTAGPVPVILELAFARDYLQALARPLPDPKPPGTPGEWGVDGRAVLARGWGFAIMNPAGFQADDGGGLTQGIIGLMNKGQPRGLQDWGALRAWAWGASRALDYLETDSAVDARQVGIEGHSRFGKAALVTMAYDPRFAICYSSSSGEGGAKLYRHILGEQMPNLASSSLYHWFSGNFLRYGGPLTPDKLPVDAHELIALAAPRPVFIGGGASTGDGYTDKNGDAWADPRGMFLAEVAAGPVYRLLGAKDLGTTQFPPPETALVTGELAFRQHPYGHTPSPNWPAFLDYASHYLHAQSSAPVLAELRH